MDRTNMIRGKKILLQIKVYEYDMNVLLHLCYFKWRWQTVPAQNWIPLQTLNIHQHGSWSIC